MPTMYAPQRSQPPVHHLPALPTKLTDEIAALDSGYIDLWVDSQGRRRLQASWQRHTVLCSVYPRDLTAELEYVSIKLCQDPGEWYGLPMTSKRTWYELPAAPEDGYSLCKVLDTAGTGLNMERGSDFEPFQEIKGRIKSSHSVAQELINKWVRELPGVESGHTIGVGMIRGDEPTNDELNALRNSQRAYCEYVANQAMDHWQSGQPHRRAKISPFHRWCTDYIGHHDAPYMIDVSMKELKKCLACKKKIDKEATVCPECRNNLVEYALRFDMTTEEMHDPVVAEMVRRERIRASRTKKRTVKPEDLDDLDE